MRLWLLLLFLVMLLVPIATPSTGQCDDCPLGQPCVTDLGCRISRCNLRCVGVKRGPGPKVCVLVAPQPLF